jgi:hypothetical protein
MRPRVYSRQRNFYPGILGMIGMYEWKRSMRRAEHNPKPQIKGSMSDIIKYNHDKDGVDRRGFKCMAWVTGRVLTMTGESSNRKPQPGF